MKVVGKHLIPAVVITLIFTIVTGLIYPGIVTGIAQLIFPYQANSSLRTSNGQVIGSNLIGQYWQSPRYFHGRPSATLSDDGSKAQPCLSRLTS
jgi:K+-transporting ATPase ATPase C chain